MQKQLYFMFGILMGVVLMIALSIQTAESKDYKFIPASNTNILNSIAELKYNSQLEVEIFGYVETLTKENDTQIIKDVLKVQECYLKAGIDETRITIGLGNKGGFIEEKFKFEKDGVYIKLCSK